LRVIEDTSASFFGERSIKPLVISIGDKRGCFGIWEGSELRMALKQRTLDAFEVFQIGI